MDSNLKTTSTTEVKKLSATPANYIIARKKRKAKENH